MGWRDLLLIFLVYIALGAKYEAREAHKHTHVLACSVGEQNLCSYAEKAP